MNVQKHSKSKFTNTGWLDYRKDDWLGMKSLWAEEQEMDRGGEMEAMGYAG